MDINQIAYCKIFPSIGIARVGNSLQNEIDEGWFIGPEMNDQTTKNFSYKDSEGRVKRQAARFRIYAFNHENKPLGEINSTNADVTWITTLANKKAAWFDFDGGANALSIFEGTKGDYKIRNPKIGQIEYDSSKNRFVVDSERKSKLEINGGRKEINGSSITIGPKFVGNFKEHYEVFLGELKTDELGRLIVLGGYGNSGAIDDSGNLVTNESWIRNYANNNDWYDDISDGPVNAVVKIEGKDIKVEGSAWVIVAPPDFAPDIKSVVSLYDVMEEVAFNNSLLDPKKNINPISHHSNEDHIIPILSALHQMKWVNERALKGHGSGAIGDFQKGNSSTLFHNELFPLSKELDSPKGFAIRKKIFDHLRSPSYPFYKNYKKQADLYDKSEIIAQANSTFMPPLSGDEGDLSDNTPGTWMTLTYLQYERFKNWVHSPYKNDVVDIKSELELEIENLTKVALKNTTGAPFYPGIELTSICKNPNLYMEAYRINEQIQEAGDLTKYMAVPWQADMWECQQHWWPAHRPDDVMTDEQFEALFDKFSEEVGENYDKILNIRCDWGRGIGSRLRPSDRYLRSRLLPRIENINCEKYLELLSGKLLNSTQKTDKLLIKKTYFDSLSRILFRELNFDTSELPNLWRIQFLWQETLDNYSGLYFHLKASSPEQWLSSIQSISINNIEVSNQYLYEVKKDWAYLRNSQPKFIKTLSDSYSLYLKNEIINQIHSILYEFAEAYFITDVQKVDTDQFIDAFKNSVKKLEEEKYVFADFTEKNNKYKILRGIQLIEICQDLLYKQATAFAGDMEMVTKWHSLGFVVKHEFEWYDKVNQKDRKNTIHIEKERMKYDGESFRDYFYYLMNIQEYPDFIPYSIGLVDQQLQIAEDLIKKIGIEAPMHPEAPIEYSKYAFNAKMDEIYRIVKVQADTAKGWRTDRTKEMVIQSMRENPVFNQTDGTWLRFIATAGPLDEITSVLSEIWADETGNGNPALHHGNIYTTILRSVGIYLPDINSKEYAYHKDIFESSYISTVFQLAVSLHSEKYFPEILGMTLFLEWEVLSIVPKIKRNEYLGIDTQYMVLHVGIDNAIEGHGAKAKKAVELYLDEVLNKSGQEAMQREWERIWRGAIAFSISTSGYGFFGKDALINAKYKPRIEEKVKEIMQSLTKYGSINHTGKNLGGHRINDLFDEPEIFIKKMATSPYINPGKPEESRFLTHLTTFTGPMFKVFDSARIQIWREWISWLGKEGDTDTVKLYISKAKAMYLLLSELRTLAMSSKGHKTYSIGKNNKIAEFFETEDIIGLMKAFKEKDNGWVVPYMPDDSPLIVDFAVAHRPMGAMLDRMYPNIGNQIGRVIIIKWIEAGCPLPGEEEDGVEKAPPSKIWNGKQLLIQQVGMGAVH